jgi:hypothetical protein
MEFLRSVVKWVEHHRAGSGEGAKISVPFASEGTIN